jgi:hypothetical protein
MAIILCMPVTAIASPLYDYFGPLNEATFGGTGIPNDEVAVASQWEDGDVLITVALSATQRYSNPPLTNDGAGTYFAGTGSNYGGSGESTIEGALWNFNYFIKVEGINGATPKLTDYQINLFYDFDPAFDNGPSGLGNIDMTQSIQDGSTPNATLAQDSQNLMFGFLATDSPPYLTAPGYSPFDPNTIGEYNFAIQVTRAGWNVEQVRMDVQVVPIPPAVWLFGTGLFGLVAIARRRKTV